MIKIKRKINFDNNATAPPTKHTLKILKNIYCKGYNNPSSVYSGGRNSMELIERARKQVANALGCDPEEIIFTSCASESNNMIEKSITMKVDPKSHHSFENRDSKYKHGCIYAMPAIVSETGEYLLNDIPLFNTKIKYFVDLTQAIGKVEINLHNYSNIAYASASGHKFGGILGCGILYIKKGYEKDVRPLIYGSQENGLRGGTYNLPAIVCFGEAIQEATKNIKKYQYKIGKMISYLMNNISESYKVGARTNVINITFKKISAATAIQLFDKYGFYISAGSACNSGDEEPSDVYLATGYSKKEAMKTIRISLGINNSMREVKKFIKVFNKIIKEYDN